ncbi:hypothetical protein [Nocardia sp. NPDC050406]|uniref:WD40 repeat domain-containing protein n=1 Tax=Nocardia sp. NPDC050406 TaxID=3364318 RepID=UPI0037AFDF19
MQAGEQSKTEGREQAEQSTGNEEFRSPRALFAQRFAELYEAAGNPTLRRVASATEARMRAAKGSRPGGASAQRISDWKAGRNVPARFESLLPVVLTLVELAHKAGHPLPRTLAEPREWQRLWQAATTWNPEDEDESACPYLGLTSYRGEDRDLFFGRTRPTAELTALVRAATGIVAVVGASGAGKSSLLAAGLAPALADWEVIALTPGPHPLATLLYATTPAPSKCAATAAVPDAVTLSTAEGSAPTTTNPPDPHSARTYSGSGDNTVASAAGPQLNPQFGLTKPPVTADPADSDLPTVSAVPEKSTATVGSAQTRATAEAATTTKQPAAAVPARAVATARPAAESPDDHEEACRGNLAPHPERPRRILIIDQFEELFTVCADEAECEEFLRVLDTCATRTEDPIAVVLAIRADFYARCLSHPVLQDALEHRSFLLGPMRIDELAQAITGPARAAGLELEPGLEELVITELCGVGDHHHPRSYDPGALPLLSHVMAATWQEREGRRLTVGGYRKAGGVTGSVAATAEHAWNELTEPQRQAAKHILLGLVTVGQDSRDTRRTARYSDLLSRSEDRDAATAAMELLSRTRLITLDAEAVTLTHEIVLTAWPRLRGWINEDRVGYLVRQRLEADAAEWAAHQRDSSRLYRGALLRQALDNAEPPPVADLAREFLTASKHSRDHARRRSTRTKVVLAVLGVVLLALGFAAYTQTQLAEQQRTDKNFAAILDQADRLQQTDPSLAAQLYLVAADLRPGDEQVRTRLLRTQNLPLVTSTPAHADGIYELVRLPGSSVLASIAYDDTLRLWDTADSTHPRQLGSPIEKIGRVAFAPNGKLMATTTPGGAIRLWDMTDPAAPRELTSRSDFATEPGFRAEFTADGRALVIVTTTRLTLWDVSNPAVPISGPSYPVSSSDPSHRDNPTIGWMESSPRGRLVAFTYYEGITATVQLWDISGPTAAIKVGEIVREASSTGELAFSPDGKYLALGNGSAAMEPLDEEMATVELLDVSEPARPRSVGEPLRTTEDYVSTLAFSTDGQLLAIGGNESATLWNVTEPEYPVRIENPLSTGRATCRFGETSRPCAGGPLALAFTQDGHTLAAAGQGGELLMWSLPPAHLYGHAGWAYQPSFDASGERMVTHASDGRIIVWDIRNQRQPIRLGEYRLEPEFYSTTLSPDGRTLLLTHLTPAATQVLDLSDPARIRPLAEWKLNLGSLGYTAITADWRLMATNHDDKTIRFWDISDRARPVPVGVPLQVNSKYAWPRFLSDNRALLVQELGSEKENGFVISRWDVSDLEHPKRFDLAIEHASRDNLMQLTPDFRTVVLIANETMRSWDISDPEHPVELGEPTALHTRSVGTLQFTADASTMITTSTDGTVQLWDFTDRAHPRGIDGPLTEATEASWLAGFLPGGDFAYTSGLGGAIRLWDLDESHAVDRICAVTADLWTEQLWQRYVPQLPYAPPCG